MLVLFFQSLTASAAETPADAWPPTGWSAPAAGSDADEDPAPDAPPALSVDADSDGFVAIRRAGPDGAYVPGGAMLADVPLVWHHADVTLPAGPPAGSWAAGETAAYTVTLTTIDPDADPPESTWVSPSRLVYVPEPVPAGAAVGWNLVDSGTGARMWLPLSAGVSITREPRTDDGQAALTAER
jgi:hypothetical protein